MLTHEEVVAMAPHMFATRSPSPDEGPRITGSDRALTRPWERLQPSSPVGPGQEIRQYDVGWHAPHTTAEQVYPMFAEWPRHCWDALPTPGKVCVFGGSPTRRAEGISIEYGSSAHSLVADEADLDRWDAERNAFVHTAGDLDRQVRLDQLPHSGSGFHSWLPWRRRAWRRQVSQRLERLRAAYETYRPRLNEIEAAVAATAQAREEVVGALNVVHEWHERTRWCLVVENQERRRMTRQALCAEVSASAILVEGLLDDVREHASELRHTQLKAVLWDQPSLELCARELGELSAELPFDPQEETGTRRAVGRTSTGQPMIFLVPATFERFYRLRFEAALDDLTNVEELQGARRRRKLEQQRQVREQREHEKRLRQRTSDSRRPGGSWPTSPGNVGDSGGGGHSDGSGHSDGGGYSSGGHSGGFGGSF